MKTRIKQLAAGCEHIIAYKPLQHGCLDTQLPNPCRKSLLRKTLMPVGANPQIVSGAVQPEAFNRVAYFALHIQAAYVPLDPHGTEKFLNLQCEMLPKTKALSLKHVLHQIL